MARLAPVLALAACYPNPNDLRAPSSGPGSGGAAVGSGGAIGTGGARGSGGATGSGGALGSSGGVRGSGGALGSSGGAPGSGGVLGRSGGAPGAGGAAPGTGGAGGAILGTGGRPGTGGAPGSGGYVGNGTALIPDATGRIAGTSNAFGIDGFWYSFSDGQASAGNMAPCQQAGHPSSQCSMFTSPLPDMPFASSPDKKMCAAGMVAQVVNGANGMPDYGNIYGAAIGFHFAFPPSTASIMQLNAIDKGITGIAFDMDTVPANGLRVELVTSLATGVDPTGGSAYWGAAQNYPLSPVGPGTNRVYWSRVLGPTGVGFDPTRLQSMNFHVPTNGIAASSFSFCISNVTVLTDPDPSGVTCGDPARPVFCPASGGAPAGCGAATDNCFTVTFCGGTRYACGSAHQYFDCMANACLTCSTAGSTTGCPALGSAPAGCWSDGTVCSTVVQCGGGRGLKSCSDPTQYFDCGSNTCQPR